MQACFIKRYGSAEQVRVGSCAEPMPLGPEDVLVQMHAASVNPIDFKTRSGAVKALLRYRMPLILGSDVAGTVLAVGSAATAHFAVGDHVAARLRKDRIGAFAERVLVHRAQLAKLPPTVEFAEGAAVALAGLTAWQCLTQALRLQPGQRVLIHAGAGGVGHLAIQLAKGLGAHVTTTASPDCHAWLTKLGADVCVDYKTQDFRSVCAPFDAVLDSQGGINLLHSIAHTTPGGAVVSIGDVPTPEVAREFAKPWLAPVFWWLSRRPRAAALARNVRYRYWFMREDGAQLAMLLDRMARGQLAVTIAARFPLAQADLALKQSEAGRTRGKIVILGQR
jgi:NADPH:quinone reductase-like Zn-dependent oxidoreductase